MLRTLLILAAALPLAACGSDDAGDTGRPTRVVCTEGGRTTVDDFAVDGVDTSYGTVFWNSATQNGRMRATGDCVTYPAVRGPDWKPTLPGAAR